MQQNQRESETEYDIKLENAQKNLKLRPVVWNKGRTVGAVPLSKLSNRVGLHDIDEDNELEMKV